jgi:hypothetical protein
LADHRCTRDAKRIKRDIDQALGSGNYAIVPVEFAALRPLLSLLCQDAHAQGLPCGKRTFQPSGWNVERQKHDYEDQDRIKRDFRDVETPTPPLLYSLLVHGRSPSVVNRRADLRTISVPPNG